MNGISRYLIGLIGVCTIASVARMMLSGSKHFKSLGNVIIGIFIIFSVLSPIIKIEWGAENFAGMSFSAELDQIAADANAYQERALRESIISQTKAYVWNKAKELSLEVELEITLSESHPYAPCGIQIIGHTSPYAKARLSEYLANEIGIPKEAQVWKSEKS